MRLIVLVLTLTVTGLAGADVMAQLGPLQGVTVTALAPEAAGEAGRGGVLVVSVDPLSDVATIIHRGDIVYEINGQPIATEADFARVANHPLPAEVPIRIRRR